MKNITILIMLCSVTIKGITSPNFCVDQDVMANHVYFYIMK